MRFVRKIDENRTDRLQAEEAGNVVRVEFVPLVEQRRIFRTGNGQNHAEFRLFDLRWQRPVTVFLPKKNLLICARREQATRRT